MGRTQADRLVRLAMKQVMRGSFHPIIGTVGVALPEWVKHGLVEPDVQKEFREALVEWGAKLQLAPEVEPSGDAAAARAKGDAARARRTRRHHPGSAPGPASGSSRAGASEALKSRVDPAVYNAASSDVKAGRKAKRGTRVP